MKNVQELEEALLVKQGIISADHGTGTVTGTGVDTKDFDTLMLLVASGVVTATGTVDVTLEESDVLGSGYSAIVGAVLPQITEANDQTDNIIRVKCKNFKRFIRAVAVVATDTAEFSATFVLGKFDGLAKVTQTNTPVTVDYVSDGGTVGSEAT